MLHVDDKSTLRRGGCYGAAETDCGPPASQLIGRGAVSVNGSRLYVACVLCGRHRLARRGICLASSDWVIDENLLGVAAAWLRGAAILCHGLGVASIGS